MKDIKDVKSRGLEDQCIAAFTQLLARVPFVTIEKLESKVRLKDVNIDILAQVRVDGESWQLIGECKRNGYPQQVRLATMQIQSYLSCLSGAKKYGIIIAPFISEQTAELCKQAGVGFLDLAGNYFLSFGHVFIEACGAQNPFRFKQELRSLFSPKAEMVLQVLLQQPSKSWKVTELATQAQASLGHVSKVRKLLLEYELAKVGEAGLILTKPEELLHAWQKVYKPRVHDQNKFYTLLHGAELETAIRSALIEAGKGEHAVLASFSAAQWLAPYVRQATGFFYADKIGIEILKRHLSLKLVTTGANIIISEPLYDDIFVQRSEAAPGIWCTSLIRTWLDLSIHRGRGEEAAEFLMKQKLLPLWVEAA